MPGYVCRYDDYEGDFEEADAALSYGSVVSEMGRTVKSHGPHQPADRGTHMGQRQEAQTVRAKAGDDFGAGLE